MNNTILNQIEVSVYEACKLQISNLSYEQEGKAYEACQFRLNKLKIICRTAKITPKKAGQFVTCWKRNDAGITEPFAENDQFDFLVINVSKENSIGQFVFPKSILKSQGILSTDKKDGKRGFRVYPAWDKTTSKQAEKTQSWQLNYFFLLDEDTDLNQVKTLYQFPK
ncbi:MepB family protein [Sunxiuqinia elliptica]